VQAHGENAARYTDRWLGGFQRGCVGRAILLKKFLRCCGPIVSMRIRFVPARLNFGKLLLALLKLVDRVKG